MATHPKQLVKVISGGQIGADIAGLRAAKKLGIPTGGYMPYGFKTLDGPRPDYAEEYGIIALPTPGYPARTKMNVIESQATVRFASNWNSGGERATLRELKRYGRPWFNVTLTPGDDPEFDVDPSNLRAWLEENGIEILNVAGNAHRVIEHPVEQFLLEALRRKEQA